MSATLFDLDEEAPAVEVDDDCEEGADPSVMPLKDPAGALRQQLMGWARRTRSTINPTLVRQALETAGQLFAEHGMRARWMLCTPAVAETMAPKLRARVDQILKAAGLEAVFDEELFPSGR